MASRQFLFGPCFVSLSHLDELEGERKCWIIGQQIPTDRITQMFKSTESENHSFWFHLFHAKKHPHWHCTEVCKVADQLEHSTLFEVTIYAPETCLGFLSGKHIAEVFVHLALCSFANIPLFSSIPLCGVIKCEDHPAEKAEELFSLEALFDSLPQREFHDSMDAYRCWKGHQQTQSKMVSLAIELQHTIFSFLDSADTHALACVCQQMNFLVGDIVPGLKLSLYPHQSAALSWMIRREAAGSLPIQHPFFSPLSATVVGCQSTDEQSESKKVCFLIDQVKGKILPQKCYYSPDCAGGLFCDEPGLGKTITALALILKTKAQISAPPLSVVLEFEDHCGTQLQYYKVSKNVLIYDI